MTTPEQIIAKIEEIEKMNKREVFKSDFDFYSFTQALLKFKQNALYVMNLPAADPPEGSPGQEDMKG